MAKTTVKKSKKTRRIVQHGQAHIMAGFNNTIVSITDEKGNVLTWATGGSAGFKGARESTPYAAQITAEQAIERAKTLHSIESVDVYVKGIGIGREQCIRGLISGGIELRAIYDITPIPHNGCRKKKVRKL
ncbi:30S ribosomal protein S11 [Candidatus Gracilibacteria bacterium]|nr:30S ribosomal protein S11 [Candidatus Gracilibacteria bacterium]